METSGAAAPAMASSASGNVRLRGVKLSPEVADVLSRSTAEGSLLRLPAGQLDRLLYTAVDKALKAMGGKWNRSKGGHVFDRSIGDELTAALSTGLVVDAKKTNEQFFTPRPLAARLWEFVDLDIDDHVLEPSAGAGALLANPIRVGCAISAVEIDSRLAASLIEQIQGIRERSCGVWNTDFLEWSPISAEPITAILMNPPFSAGKDVQHAKRAWDFLAPLGRFAAIMGEHAFMASDRRSVDFRMWLGNIGARVENVPAGAFKESGTMVAARIVMAVKR